MNSMVPTTPKGKGKANEQTPLLDEGGRGVDTTPVESASRRLEISSVSPSPYPSLRQVVWRSYLLTAVLAILSLFLGLLLATILLADSYAAPAWRNVSKALSNSGRDSHKFWNEALVVGGPDDVRFTGVERKQDEFGIVHLEVNMTVAMRIAVDTDFVMTFREDRVRNDTWWKKKWKAMGRWIVGRLGNTTAIVGEVAVYSSNLDSSEPLLILKPLAPITIPLLPGLSPRDHHLPPSTLEPSSIPLTLYPSQNASLLFEFFKLSWAQGFVSVRVHGSDLIVRGGSEYIDLPKLWELGRWRNWLKFSRDDIKLELALPVPPFIIPSHPPSKPGSPLPKFSELLVLESFNITSASSMPKSPSSTPTRVIHPSARGIHVEHAQHLLTSQDINSISLPSQQPVPPRGSILISAHASLAHPFAALASKLGFGHGFPPLAFIVSLPVPSTTNHTVSDSGQAQDDVVPFAELSARPEINTTHIRMPLSGFVLPISNSSVRLSHAISAFISSHLSYKPSPVSLSTPLYPSLTVDASFPPPSHRLRLLRDVKIEDMNIHPWLSSIPLPLLDRGTRSLVSNRGMQALEILASATVKARIVLPRGMDLDIRVVRLWTDCLVFDGEIGFDTMAVNSNSSYTPYGVPLSGNGSSTEAEEPPVPTPLPLPTPLPDRAFGRITPRTWLNATSSSVPRIRKSSEDLRNEEDDDGTGTDVHVTAQLVDVPLKVLPGRQGDLSRFVTKVLMSRGPVVAGIRGVVAVGAGIPGLTIPISTGSGVDGNELILTGLPFEGNVRVGQSNVEP